MRPSPPPARTRACAVIDLRAKQAAWDKAVAESDGLSGADKRAALKRLGPRPELIL